MQATLTAYLLFALDATANLIHRWPLHHAPNSESSSDHNNMVRLFLTLVRFGYCDANDGHRLIVRRVRNVPLENVVAKTSISIPVVQRVLKNATLALRLCWSLFHSRPSATTIRQNFHVLWQNRTSYCIRSKPNRDALAKCCLSSIR